MTMIRLFPWREGSVIALLLLLLFLPVFLAPSGTLLGEAKQDTISVSYTQLRFEFGELRAGRTALWNPHVLCGYPQIASPESTLFYPLNLHFLLLRTAAAMNLAYALHLLLAGFGMLCLLRRHGLTGAAALVGALSFALSTPLVSRIIAGHIYKVMTLAWLPLLWWAADRLLARPTLPRAVLAALLSTLQFFAGDTQYFFITHCGLLLYAVLLQWQRRAWRPAAALAAALLLVPLLGALVLLPSWELAGECQRARALYDFSSSHSLPPVHLLTLLAPALWGNHHTVPYVGMYNAWEMNVYAGLVPLLLALGTVRRWRELPQLAERNALAGVALAGLILAFGRYTPVYRLCFDWLPGFAYFRGPSKFVILTVLALAVFAAHGMALWQTAPPRRGLGRRLLLLAGGGAILLALLTALWPSFCTWYATIPATERSLFCAPSPSLLATSLRQAWMAAGQALLLVAGYLVLSAWRGRYRGAGLVLLVMLDLGWLAAGTLRVTCRPEELRFSGGVRAVLDAETAPFRVIVPGVFNNFVYRAGYEDMLGEATLVLRGVHEYLLATRYGTDTLDARRYHDTRLARLSPLFDLLNLRYVVFPAAFPLPPAVRRELRTVHADTQWVVASNPSGLPRYRFHTDVRVRAREATVGELLRAGRDAGTFACVEAAPPFPVAADPAADRAAGITLLTQAPDGLTLRVTAPADGLLVVADAWYPGWRATVDGVEVPVVRVNSIVRGLWLRAGKHTVRLAFVPLTVYGGTAVTVATALLLLLLAGRARRRSEGAERGEGE